VKKILAITSGTALLFCGLAGSTASATPGSAAGTVTPSNQVFGTLDGPAKAKQDGITFKSKDDVKVRTFTLTYDVGAYSGWHQHPGIVIATVVSGTVVQRVGCDKPKLWTAGQSFTEVKPHYVSNLYRSQTPGAVPAVLSITQIYPADIPTPELREDLPAPHCPGS
jgi:quercetin dioxygenase-like cupin family protein